MKWLNKIADEVITRHPKGEILVSSGASPSGSYHIGHLREIIICDAIKRELQNRDRQAKHLHYVDDLDGLRKTPVDIPAEHEKYLGQSLCDIPAPGGKGSYADYFFDSFLRSAKALGVDMEVIRSHEKYRAGFFTDAIEKSLAKALEAKKILETVSGRKLGKEWSPIQVNEGGYLKKRAFQSIDTNAKTITYFDKDGAKKTTSYQKGEVKLDWRIDWPARWWLLGVDVEPFGRDHASAGGSYDTGEALVREIFGGQAPLPVPYDFVNRAGDTKKMSASQGTGLSAAEVVDVLPPEIVRFFMLRFPPEKRLYFDSEKGVAQLIDDFAELMQKEPDSKVISLSQAGSAPVISSVPFSHLVGSYQASLRDSEKTIEVIKRTEHADVAGAQAGIIKKELAYIDNWLDKWAPEDIKFELRKKINKDDFSAKQQKFLKALAEKIAAVPANADGDWFHKTIYDLKDTVGMEPKAMFETLYRALIGKTSGPRAGWFLSILPRDWLMKRLKLEG
ncbi:lysine--tRNA ligase [Candidatus Saccharibacteria bacterium]|nr:lysine--tRNA ligase [Candidatus Saccharibacteria bacterium]